jgi:hypothetical protein
MSVHISPFATPLPHRAGRKPRAPPVPEARPT